MTEIAGWQISETLYQGRHSLVYRGLKEEQSVIIKVPSSPHAETKLLQEFQLGQRISSKHVVKFIELKLDSTYGHILIEEDDHSESLLHIIPANGFTPLAFLNIAIQLAEGLQHIHESNVIHKDVKSSNIIIRSDTGKVKYIDFNSASMLRNNQQTKINPISTTEATLAYISPEQTGRINRMIDYRTDFYSLGVTFYQLLCGRLPFTVKTVAELVHCHLAKQPLPPHQIRSCIPKTISDIVMKLMQKNAECRYQSACGLLADLKRCLEELSQTGEVQPFVLAERDIPENFCIPEKLYGRELETSLLTQICDRVCGGSTEMVMIAGAPGTGKSALVQEIQPYIAAKGGHFLMGKFESMKSHNPYSAIVQAFQSWIQQVLASSNEEIRRWKTTLLNELGNQGQLIVDILPDLELIIGRQTSLHVLDAEQSKIRFHVAFQHFIAALTGTSVPFLLFLDDWQWADPGSVTLLEALLTDSGIHHLLVIGTYRDHEIEDLHVLLKTLKTVQSAGVPVQTITLYPLSMSTVNQWTAETMRNSQEATLPLTAIIYQKTAGFPFFVRVFLQLLFDQGLLTQMGGQWQWNLENIRKLPVTENVISFLIQQMQQLTPMTQNTLQIASCVGHRFSFDKLYQIQEISKEELQLELDSTVKKGLLLRSEDDYWFAHDKIQEAIYQQIPQKRYASIHLSIGRKLKTNSKWLFEAVGHLNRGKVLMRDESELIELAKLNLAVGKKAKQDIAYASALNYLQIAESCLSCVDIWKQDYVLALEVHKELAEVEHLNMHYESSTSYVHLLLEHTQGVFEKLDIYNMFIIHQTLRAQYQDAVNTALQALRLLGIELASQDLISASYNELNRVKTHLQGKSIDFLLNAPDMSDSSVKLCMQLMDNMLVPAYFCNQDLHDFIVAKMVYLTLCHGNSMESARAYATYGMLSVHKWREIQRGHALGLLALKISEKSNNLVNVSRTYVLYAGFIHHWKLPLEQVEFYISRAQQTGEETGDYQFAGYSQLFKALYLFHVTTPLNVLEKELNRCLQIPYNRSNKMVLALLQAVLLIVLNLTGQTSGLTVFQDGNQTDSEYQFRWKQEQQFEVSFNFLVLKAQSLYIHQEISVSMEVLTEAQNYLRLVPGYITVASYHFYSALNMLALYPTAREQDKQNFYLETMDACEMQLKIWAEHCPENFLHKLLLVQAEKDHIVIHNLLNAEGKYEQAIQAAHQHGSLQDQALANELAAKFFLNQNKPNCARGFLQAASQLYERWGAKRKVDQLISQYSEVFCPPKLSSFSICGEEEVISSNSLRLLDLTTILKTSQTISSDVDLRNLLVKIMTILVTSAGAHKGSFLLVDSSELFVQAEYTVDGEVQTLQKLPLSLWEGGACSIVEYVKRTQQSVLLSNASTDRRFNQDPYISIHCVQSVLCIPIIRHQQLKGILYLENNLAPHIFSEQHMQIITILACQIAISLENAFFYESVRSISERLNLALQSGNIGTWSWNIQENKVIWDQYMYDLHGIKEEDFDQTYEGAKALVHPDDIPKVEQAIKKTLSDNEPCVIEYHIIKPDKSTHVMVAQGKVFRDEKGQAERLIGVVWDVTQRKQLEEERLQALSQAEEKERRRAEDAEKYRKNLEDFTNLVCHEIRNPMTGIYGNIDFLQQTATSLKSLLNMIPKETQRKGADILNRLDECTKQIEQCIKHQKAIIDDVLDLSKLESGKTALASHPFGLKTIITEVAQIFTASMELKHLSLFFSLPETDPWVMGDENRLKMVLINIIANALKFTEQGYVKITLQLAEVTSIYTTFNIIVEDTGIGMTAEEQSQLFQRFARVAAAEFEGSGLGLYISKRFIEYMGGEIIVQSQKGKGSEFSIHLKLESTQAEDRKSATQSCHSLTPALPVLPAVKHILVVEDNIVNQRILCKQLQQAGYHCEVANNGQEALDKWSSSWFDLIFMDIEMPVMGGFEATQTIRKQEQQLDITCRIPIVGLSAYTSPEFVKQAHETGMDDYITKPYEKEKLFQAIAKYTEMGREKTEKSLFETSNEVSPTMQHKKARIE